MIELMERNNAASAKLFGLYDELNRSLLAEFCRTAKG